MEAKERRNEILQLLRNRTAPVTGGELAQRMGVSRQVIVQDIALLRTGGVTIFATPEGYLMPAMTAQGAARRVFAAKHLSNAKMRQELEIIVDAGCTVVNVSIEHAVYGEISAPLMLRTRTGVEVFMANFEKGETVPISQLTGGVHLHTVEAPNEQVMDDMMAQLRREGILVE